MYRLQDLTPCPRNLQHANVAEISSLYFVCCKYKLNLQCVVPWSPLDDFAYFKWDIAYHLVKVMLFFCFSLIDHVSSVSLCGCCSNQTAESKGLTLTCSLLT